MFVLESEARVEDAGVCASVCARWRDDDDGVVGDVGVFKRFFPAWFDCSLVR